ncbi:hypothetical protein Droror1_Dr00025118 [Drosera rotundifolia]
MKLNPWRDTSFEFSTKTEATQQTIEPQRYLSSTVAPKTREYNLQQTRFFKLSSPSYRTPSHFVDLTGFPVFKPSQTPNPMITLLAFLNFSVNNGGKSLRWYQTWMAKRKEESLADTGTPRLQFIQLPAL